MPTSWTGYYLDGRTAARQEATVVLSSNTVEITTTDSLTRTWSYDELELAQGTYAGEPVRLDRRNSSESIVIPSNSILTALHRLARVPQQHIHDPSTRSRRLWLTAVAGVTAVCLAVSLYRWGIPALSVVITSYIPVSWEQRMGEEAVAYFALEERRCKDPYRTKLVQSIFADLIKAAQTSPYEFKLYLVDSPSVNALAAPGGHIVVFRGLLEQTESAEQLAGVLAHEIQHVLQRHSMRMLTEQIFTTILLLTVSGDFSSAMTYSLQSVQFLGQLQYSQSHETQADEEGLKLIVQAGLDPNDMIAFYRIIGDDDPKEFGALAYLSSHPLIEQRIARLEQLAGKMSINKKQLLADFDWKFVRAACRTQATPPSSPSEQLSPP